MSKILITGTTGFVGSALCRALRDRHHIIELNRRIADGSAVAYWDFRGPLPGSLPAQSDVVIHAAAENSHSAVDCFSVNVGATSALLEYARGAGVNTFIYLSTGSVYGDTSASTKECSPIIPQGTYACTKAAGEFVVHAYQDYFRALTLRLYFPYGPGQRPDRLIPRIFDRVSRGDAIQLKGASGPTINPVYIDDLVMWVRLLLESGAQGTFNLAGTERVSIRQLSERIGRLIGRLPCFDEQVGDPIDIVGDSSEIERAVSYTPQYTLDMGLCRLRA